MFRMLRTASPRQEKSFRRYLIRWTFLSIPVGIITSLSVVLLVLATESMWNLLYGHQVPRTLIVIVPAIGGLVSGYIASRTVMGASHGAELIIDALQKYGGVVPLLTAPIGFLTSLVTIGSGGSAGLEGPSLHIGGTMGSVVGSKAGLSTRDRRILILCGAAAGISAAFKAPLTGAIFALEVPYKNDLEHAAVAPALVSSVISYIIFVLILGSEPLFVVTPINFAYYDIPHFIFQGVFSAIIALVFVKFFKRTNDLFHSVKLPIALKAGLGGLVVGLLGIATPQVLGIGYEGIQQMLTKNLQIEYLVMLLALKIVATSFTLGSGGNGGVFIPTVFIGTAAGSIFGKVFAPHSAPMFEVLGMASLLAASLKVPIAAVAFISETANPSYIIPAIITSVVAYVASGGMSLYSHQQVAKPTLVDVTAQEIMDSQRARYKFVAVDSNSTLEDITREIFRHHQKVFPVVARNELAGVISISDMMKVPRQDWKKVVVSDIMTRKDIIKTTPEQSVSEIVRLMGAKGIEMIPVVESKASSRIVGAIYRYDILHTIDEQTFE